MNSVLSIVLVLLLAAPVDLEASRGRYEEWAEGAVKWLLTSEELDEWQSVDSQKAAEEFINQFWARRDPFPSTPGNEARHVFRQRQADADQRFSFGRTSGSLTDRGMVLVLLGPPNAIAEIPSDGQKPPAEIWFWEGENRPVGAEDQSVNISFVDEYGMGNYRIPLIDRGRVETLLERARRELIEPSVRVMPAVEVIPGSPSSAEVVELEEAATEFSNQELKAAWEGFDDSNHDPDIHLSYGEFMTAAGQYYVSLQVYVPASSGLNTMGELIFFGGVTDRSGELVAVYEDPARLLVTRTDAYLDRTLALPPGEYIGTFGLAKGGVPIAMARTKLDLQGLRPGEPGISRLFLSNNIFPLIETRPVVEPFTFGDMKVVPKSDSRFSTRDMIWYALELRNPDLDQNGRPQVHLQLMVEGKKRDGTLVKKGAPLMATNAHPVRNQPGRYLIGGSFERGALDPGTYQLTLQVVDEIADRVWDARREFEVVAK